MKVKEGKAVTLTSVLEKRWSARSFLKDPISDEVRLHLLEAARWSASCFNEQPWRFIVGRKGEPEYDALLSALLPGNQTWASKAPMLIASFAKRTFTHNGKPNDYAHYDVGAAMACLTAEATNLGLSVHQMGGFNKGDLIAAFQVDTSDFDAVVMTAIGYPGNAAQLPDNLKVKEEANQERKSLEQLLNIPEDNAKSNIV